MTETYAVDDYADIARRIAELRPTVAGRFAVYYVSPSPNFGISGWCKFNTPFEGFLSVDDSPTLFDTAVHATTALHESRSWCENDQEIRDAISVRPYPVEEE